MCSMIVNYCCLHLAQADTDRRRCPFPLSKTYVPCIEEPAAMAAATASTKVCCDKCQCEFDAVRCNLLNKKLVEEKGRHPIYRCKDCCSLVNRITTIKGKDVELSNAITNLQGEERAEFYKSARFLFGPELKKKMVESTEIRETERSEHWKLKKGPAMTHDEAAKHPRFASKPEALARLLADPVLNFVCGHTGLEMVHVPEYTFEDKSGLVNVQTTSRTISAESNIKAFPKAKATPKVNDTEKKKKPLNAALKRKATNIITSINKGVMNFSILLVQAESEEAKAFVAPAVTMEGSASMEKVMSLKENLEELLAKNSPDDKDDIAEILNSLDKQYDEMVGLSTTMSGNPGFVSRMPNNRTNKRGLSSSVGSNLKQTLGTVKER